MNRSNDEDPRLTRLTSICLALPGVDRKLSGKHASFNVGKRTIAWFLDDHHGDGEVAVTCKVLPGDNNALVSNRPKDFFLPAYVGSRGWVALRLSQDTDWDEVNELIRGSYMLIAPKRLAALIQE